MPVTPEKQMVAAIKIVLARAVNFMVTSPFV